MSNTDVAPSEVTCGPSGFTGVLHAREVPLGGPRAIAVRRTLPQRDRTLIGAWCFADHYGPHDVRSGPGMDVPPHPHTGLQTVSWLFAGEIEHRDSGGVHAMVRPGELNLMTAGAGVSHSEVSAEGVELAGLQLWTALPDGVRAPSFQHVADLPRLSGPGWTGIVLVGSIGDAVSPAVVHTPLVGVDLQAEPGATVRLPAEPGFEHALIVVEGQVAVDGVAIPAGPLAFLGMQRERLEVAAGPTGARLVLLGGEPFEEPLVMFWNFIGRDHDQVAAARADWESDAALPLGDPRRRFGTVPGHGADRIPAPPVPPVRLRPRTRPVPPGG